MPAPKKYYLKRRLAKAMHSIWSQDWKSNGVMVQKSVGHKSKRKGMRSLRLVNLPDGKVRMLCQMTKRRAEELKRQGIAVELDVLGGSGYCTKDGTPHPHVALFDELLHHRQWNRPYFDFGTSNEEDGRILVEPLIYQKEGFGGRGICYDCYEYDL